ncbi:GNAT family N-acetyltransferase [Serratia sp. M24T3]|uniref:GNAT family N-acetyltransferase n=1 Tax=Serratia sp. M24T3 TaxID=932213 RepID=UPI00025BC0B6|nr:GNAT family N-acetyltransferase [Serratia sp. M24T3]EIC82030.1 putative acetyltransferase [Serratia sp. M24T3]
MKIVLLNAATLPIYHEELAHLLNDTHAVGLPGLLSHDDYPAASATFFHDLREAISKHQRLLWIARNEQGLVGTVQLELASDDASTQCGTISTLIVDTSARRQGVAKQLMRELENTAFNLRRGLLSLDIQAGTPAEAFYKAQGYQCSGKTPAETAASYSSRHRGRVYFKQLIPDSAPSSQRIN